jgi:anthranilate phosphoribosyltransferase
MKLFNKNDLKQNAQEVLDVINSGKCYQTLNQVVKFK